MGSTHISSAVLPPFDPIPSPPTNPIIKTINPKNSCQSLREHHQTPQSKPKPPHLIKPPTKQLDVNPNRSERSDLRTVRS